MCMIDDAEPWTFYHQEIRRAGKPHRCNECQRTIERGEQHGYAVGLTDDRWSYFRVCLHCCHAARWLIEACDGFLFDAVEEDLLEHVTGHESYLRTAPLTRLARWMAADWRDRSGRLRPVDDVRAVADRAIAAYLKHYDQATGDVLPDRYRPPTTTPCPGQTSLLEHPVTHADADA